MLHGFERESSHVERITYADRVMAKTRAERVAQGLDPIPPKRRTAAPLGSTQTA